MTTEIEGTIRIGAVSYLNSKPLIEGLEEHIGDAELVLDYPSRLADDLGRGLLDVALIPSIECLRNSEYEVISDACVATHGAVMSVKLYSRVQPGSIRKLALDGGSRTSATLARVILAERFGVYPTVELLPLENTVRSTQADAVLLIGDRAMHAPEEAFPVTWDLGEEWFQWTGLPFVFALWATRTGTELGQLDEALCRARDSGVRNLDAIARREAAPLGISEETALSYLRDNLHFRLGSAERSGLKLFHELAVKLGLAPEGVDLVFRDCATA